MSKELLNSLVSAISLSKENKIFFPIVPEDYHLGVGDAEGILVKLEIHKFYQVIPHFKKRLQIQK